jgi:hypothetical protein
MTARVLCTVFVLSLLYAPNALQEDSFAMGSKGGEVSVPNKEGGAEHDLMEQKDRKTEDGLSSQGTGSGKPEKSAPVKKPRLKYRDNEKCSC